MMMKREPHTFEADQLTYSRWERLHFRIFGWWPQSVVERRMDALEADDAWMDVRLATQGIERRA